MNSFAPSNNNNLSKKFK